MDTRLGQTPLDTAIHRRDLAEVAALVTSPRFSEDYPEAVQEIGGMLNFAARDSDARFLKSALRLLRASGIRLNTDCQPRVSFWDDRRYTLVGYAVTSRPDNEAIRLLVSLGAQPNRIFCNHDFEFLPWHVAYEAGHDNTVRLLKALGAGGVAAPVNDLVRLVQLARPARLRRRLATLDAQARERLVATEGATGRTPLAAALEVAQQNARRSSASTSNLHASLCMLEMLVREDRGRRWGGYEDAAGLSFMLGDTELWELVRGALPDGGLSPHRLAEWAGAGPSVARGSDSVGALLIAFDALGRTPDAASWTKRIARSAWFGTDADGEADLDALTDALEQEATGEAEALDVTVRVASMVAVTDETVAGRRLTEQVDVSEELHWGDARVRVPLLGRAPGDFVEENIYSRVRGRPPRGLIGIVDSRPLPTLPGPTCEQREALIFVHGYNVTLSQAVRRTAQLAVDIKASADPWAFCWPSGGRFLAYGSDADMVTAAGEALAQLVSGLSQHYEAVHVYAHSTGARIVEVAAGHFVNTDRIGELIFSAADIDERAFVRTVRKLHARCKRTTSYSSAHDWALCLSRLLRFARRPRAGETIPDLALLPQSARATDLIDASSVACRGALGFASVGHFYYASVREVLEDLHELLQGQPAQHRQHPRRQLLPRPHWKL
jgi:hypothetical protein